MDSAVSSRSGRRTPHIFLGLVLLAKIGFEVAIILHGFTSLVTQEFTNTHTAYTMLQNPQQLLTADWRPPLPYALLSGSLALYPDLFWAPRVLTIVFGLWSVLLMYQLARTLFSPLAGLLAAGLLAFSPWHVWLSATPLSDIFLLTFELGSAYHFSRFLQTDDRSHAYRMGAYAALANSVHFHAWLFTLLLTTLFLYRIWSTKRKHSVFTLAILALLWTVPLAWLANLHIVHGDAFYFLHQKIVYDESIRLPSGLPALNMAVSALSSNLSLSLWFIPSLFGAVYAFRHLHLSARLHLVLSCGLLLMVLGLFFSGHHSWRWERQLFSPVVLLLPFMAYWLEGLVAGLVGDPSESAKKNQTTTRDLASTLGSIGMLLLLLLLPTLLSYTSKQPNVLLWSMKFFMFVVGYLLVFLLTLLSLIAPLWLVASYERFRNGSPSFLSHLRWVPLAAVILAGSVISFQYFTYRPREEAVRAGRVMRTLFEQRDPKIDGNVLLEITYWDFKPVQILSNAPDRFVYDREIRDLGPNNPSLLSVLSTEETSQFLSEKNIRIAVFRTRELKEILRHRLQAREIAREGPYTIFALDRIRAQKGSNFSGNEEGN